MENKDRDIECDSCGEVFGKGFHRYIKEVEVNGEIEEHCTDCRENQRPLVDPDFKPSFKPKIHFVALGAGYWGTGNTLDECKRQFKKAGGSLNLVIIYCYCIQPENAEQAILPYPLSYNGESVHSDGGNIIAGGQEVFFRNAKQRSTSR